MATMATTMRRTNQKDRARLKTIPVGVG